MLQPKSITFDIGGGRMVSIETGKMARQADGSVVVKQGNCMLLATVVARYNCCLCDNRRSML